ncbi:MAG: hyaluronoglucosaminidase [Halieaceae bacterium]|jgi:hyaluronoglucosaminidase
MGVEYPLTPFLGVIEGFYGQAWPQATRLRMVSWLSQIGIDAYLYAPKSNPYLRKRWQEPLPPSQQKLLRELVAGCEASGLACAVGLSPFALYRAYNARARQQLRDKIRQLDDLGFSILALLFDDMPGEQPDLAKIQAHICADVADWSAARRLLVCPTFYSDDPVLDRVFGARPANYLSDLGAGLADNAELFWTGPEVCSARVRPEDLQPAIRSAGRRLALWDNYPVNDSRSRSEHLYLADLGGRSAKLGELLSSHWCNAMNQAALSLPALASLPALYGREAPLKASALHEAGVNQALVSACLPLARVSRETLDERERNTLLRAVVPGSLAARELADWLAGRYRFDPACLTD